MEHALPALPSNAFEFQILCNLLSGNDISSLGSAIDQEAVGAILQLAEQERVLPALAQRAASSSDLSKSTRAVLATHYEVNRRRNTALRGVLLELGEAAAASGVRLMGLKGAAWLLEDEEHCAAWRQMLDIDVLIPVEQFAAMSRLLLRMDYVNVSRRLDNPFHFMFLHPKLPVLVEFHRDLGWHPHLLPSGMLFDRSRKAANEVQIPETWMRAFHAIIHWQVQDEGRSRRTLPLKEVLELANFLRRSDVDWQALASHAARVGVRSECQAALTSASILLGAQLPAQFANDFNARRWVSAAMARRESPFRTWLAREFWRAGTLWRCEKVRYRCATGGFKPISSSLIFWSARLARLPLLAARLGGILMKILRGRYTQQARPGSGSAFDFRTGIPDRFMSIS